VISELLQELTTKKVLKKATNVILLHYRRVLAVFLIRRNVIKVDREGHHPNW